MLDEYLVKDGIDSDENIDEFKAYVSGLHLQGDGLNIAVTDDQEKIQWSHILNDERYVGEVSIIKGAWKSAEHCFRSSEDSMMNMDYHSANAAFNVVQREIIYKRIMSLTSSPDWEYDYENFVEFDKMR